MIITMKLLTYPTPSRLTYLIIFPVVKAPKIYSLSKSSGHNTVLLTTVIFLYNKCTDLIILCKCKFVSSVLLAIMFLYPSKYLSTLFYIFVFSIKFGMCVRS